MMKKLFVVCLLASFWISAIVHSAKAAVAQSCLVEAEAFADKGGWVVDPQFEDAIGIATWTIDLHWAKGDSGSLAETTHTRVAPWWMPYRSLCCRDPKNRYFKSMYFAGVGFGEGHEDNDGITLVDVPVQDLPKGKKLTVAIRPVSSLGTKGKSISTTFRV